MSTILQNIIDYIRGKKTLYAYFNKVNNSKYYKNFVINYNIPFDLQPALEKIYIKLIDKYKKVKLLDYKNGAVLCSFNNMKLYFDLMAPLNFYEIFINDAINEVPYIDTNIKYNVIDMGANRGYTVLHWANKSWCNKVFAFECVPDTFDILSNNVNLNENIKNKVELYPFGLSDKDSDFDIYTIKNFDISATSNLELLKKTWPDKVNDIVSVKCLVKKSSDIVKDILNKNPNEMYILKVDVEGSEYDIFKDLTTNCPDVFDRIETLFLETHLGWEEIDKYIKSLNKGYVLDSLYVNGIDIHMLVYTKLTHGYWKRKFYWTNFE